MSHRALDDATKSLGSSILYQNTTKTVVIVDIPRSIANAQGHSRSPWELYSTEPLGEPFASTEPKSEKARKNVAARNSVDSVVAGKYAGLIEKAFNEVRDDWKDAGACEKVWARRRRVRETCCDDWKGRGRKRKSDEVEELGKGGVEDYVEKVQMTESTGTLNAPLISGGMARQDESFSQEEERLQSIMKAVKHQERPKITPHLTHPCHVNEAMDGSISEGEQTHGGVWHNPLLQHISLCITAKKTKTSPSPGPMLFHIPPLSTHILSDCSDPSYLRTAVRESPHDQRTFDFILLDPPWPNTSAKRKSSYSTASQLRDLKRMLLDMDLDSYIPASGYVGVWITNAPNVRHLVLGEDGLFEAWNATLVEEWVWVKTTRYGEPVTSVHGVWRKPYEVLLLGRAPADRLATAAESDEDQTVKRVIFGCPDWHSRKPCLKVLIEGLQMVRQGGRVLEIFARHLVVGWWSWGDEVLKFNWEKYWTDDESKKDEW